MSRYKKGWVDRTIRVEGPVCDDEGVFGSASEDVERIRVGRGRGGLDGTLSSTKDGGSLRGQVP